MPTERSNGGEPSRQKRVGEALRRETRLRILEAAEHEFRVGGYAGTTVAQLAAAAGVSVQTLYLAWGNKRQLLRGYMEHALAGAAASPESAGEGFDGLTPRQRLLRLADLVAEVAERAALGWALYRDAAAVDAEIAADWDELQHLRHRLFTRILTDLPADALREGLTHSTAVDTAWAIASPDAYDLLVRRRGYNLEEFRNWMRNTLTSALLA
ncbi:MAG: TetR/AcrR family transcriptional regulator [Leucobacter sp.]